MPSRYTKIRKHVVKKKGASKVNSLHENSRDALRLRKAITRDDKVARLNRLRKGENEAFREETQLADSRAVADMSLSKPH